MKMKGTQLDLLGGATIEGDYRYDLTRRWAGGDALLWVMLNPSTANEDTDDATLRRCVGFTIAAGFSALTVVNLYALRATNPKELVRAWEISEERAVGRRNDEVIVEHASRRDLGGIVVAWGAHKMAERRAGAVTDLIRNVALRPLQCLGTTPKGAPCHPVRLAADTPLELWSWANA